ncbi:MAG: rhomboid family intramembrane serine protease [Fimbriimonadaceae bacterium]|jgi:membrane associated rhomboid family serine protease|nr:rhomboid family intramembrane serine protease [Fimbriimonadaceae bacterium]
MIPIRDNLLSREVPVVTLTLIGLNVLIYLWDRNGSLLGESQAFADLAMRPAEVVLAFTPAGDPVALGKIFTSMFLHGSLAHIIGNVLFLQAFGPGVERALGGARFTLYYLVWGFLAAGAHVFVDPRSVVPTLGASGAIGGVLGAYFLTFPGSKMKVVVPPLFFLPFNLPSWLLLALWFVFQIAFPQPGVANWAHAGGFMAGMATILFLGGRQKVTRHLKLEEDENFDDD